MGTVDLDDHHQSLAADQSLDLTSLTPGLAEPNSRLAVWHAFQLVSVSNFVTIHHLLQ